MSFSAIYMPALPPGRENPSRSGFETEAEAIEYMLTQMCSTCREERQRFVDGTGNDDYDSDDYADEWPSCSCEWVIVPTDKAEAAESVVDLLEAAGWEKVYERPS
jgi:hypothetical protein